MQSRIPLISFMSVAMAALLPHATAQARPVLDERRLEQLSKYDVLMFSDPYAGGFDKGKAIGVFDATPEEVFRVVTDLGKYKDYMPLIYSSDVMNRGRSEALVRIGAEIPWPAGKSWVDAHYQWERKPGEIFAVDFDMIQGTMKHFLGRLYIEPWSSGKASVTYELVAVPSVYAPKSVVNRGIKRLVGHFVHALRQRVNELHRLGYLHPEPIRASVVEKADRSPLIGAPPSPGALKAGR